MLRASPPAISLERSVTRERARFFLERTTQSESADPSASSCPDRHRLSLHAPDAEPSALLQSLESAITLRVGHPLTRFEAIDLQQKVEALIALRPAAIVLDVAGLRPTDEMGMLMLPFVAHAAAAEGVLFIVANPTRQLRDRLAQLGVPNLVFVYRLPPTAPREDGWDDEANDVSLLGVPLR